MNNFETLEQNLDSFNGAVGAGFWDMVFADPALYVGYVFAFMAAIAFLTFLRGFLSGFPSVITMDWHEGDQKDYRIYATWGVVALIYLFILWEIVRSILFGLSGLFG